MSPHGLSLKLILPSHSQSTSLFSSRIISCTTKKDKFTLHSIFHIFLSLGCHKLLTITFVSNTYKASSNASEDMNDFKSSITTRNNSISCRQSCPNNQYWLHLWPLVLFYIINGAFKQWKLIFKPGKGFTFSLNAQSIY